MKFDETMGHALGQRKYSEKENATHLGTLNGTFFMLFELGASHFNFVLGPGNVASSD